MAAHVPRRVFARSFVITLAAIPACQHDDPPTYNPPMPNTATPSASATATTQATNDQLEPKMPIADRGWYVTMNNGKCEAAPNNVATHVPYACPSSVPANAIPFSVTHMTDAPNCVAEYQQPFNNAGCPPNMHCNPPPPKMISVSVPCPK